MSLSLLCTKNTNNTLSEDQEDLFDNKWQDKVFAKVQEEQQITKLAASLDSTQNQVEARRGSTSSSRSRSNGRSSSRGKAEQAPGRSESRSRRKSSTGMTQDHHDSFNSAKTASTLSSSMSSFSSLVSSSSNNGRSQQRTKTASRGGHGRRYGNSSPLREEEEQEDEKRNHDNSDEQKDQTKRSRSRGHGDRKETNPASRHQDVGKSRRPRPIIVSSRITLDQRRMAFFSVMLPVRKFSLLRLIPWLLFRRQWKSQR